MTAPFNAKAQTGVRSPGALGHGQSPSCSPQTVQQRNREKTRDALLSALASVGVEGRKVTITAVAEAAGVTPALVHNTYPDIAEAIRQQAGKSSRQQRDNKIQQLAECTARNRELRLELDAALRDIRQLASINETLRQEIATLRALVSDKVAMLDSNQRR
ncbi:AcrR family transcriptional regulator [Pelomonas aquatica]|uniref:AcrR family transcriptional regulator n=1 Tax=Pelomonas aquatica TaxID=431058 RepID=A0ABU1ZDY8_9BURK|nr:AcrR family transcriptional regulator [Pelomonas aquatica]